MKCPLCSSRLRRVKSKSATLDVCPDCRGIWFNSGEFVEFVRALAKGEDIRPEETKFFQRREVRAVHSVKEKDRFCPECDTRLERFNYCADSNVFLDRCLSCGGIWVDAGEAEQVARYIKEDPRATVVGKGLAETSDIIKTEQEMKKEVAKAYSWFFPFFFPRVVVPLGSDAPRERIPIVTIVIILFSGLFFASRLILEPESLVQILKFVPCDDLRSIDLLSSMFLVGTLTHLIWDMFFLWLFGNSVEDRLGRLGYLGFFILCGLFSSLPYCFSNRDLSIVTVGISGAVSAVIGAYFIFYPLTKIRLFVIYAAVEVPTVVCFAIWFLFHLTGPLLPIAGGVAKTAWLASVFGFLMGAVVAFFKKRTS